MNEMIDNYRHKGLRKQLVEIVRSKGITDENVLKAIEEVPRHFFIDMAFVEQAYKDIAWQIGEGQTISQPFTVAYQSQLLEVVKGNKVLEIGTGSGYQACVLAKMGAKVFTIERQRKLYERTKKLLTEMGYSSVKTFFGDGYEGLPTYAPFDKILITAAATEVPPKLLEQLAIGGMMVIPLGTTAVQKMERITRTGKDEYEREEFDSFRFVPMLKGKQF